MSRSLFTLLFLLLATASVIRGQSPSQVIKGVVVDGDTRGVLAGANILIIDSDPPAGTTSDSNGKFRLVSAIGRVSLKITYLGYEDIILRDILVQTGREVELQLEMTETVVSTNEVIVTASGGRSLSINQMAAVSTNTIRPDDALRYAGGFYDPSRIVNAFAGVVTANSDESNDIVIRGNSSRGLLWRLEGIEIPNPNHFSDGQGGSGGSYSAISSSVISSFDFFTGAFPAEYGNAISGVMDLSLRKGNSDRHQFAFQTGMIGADLTAEGPLSRKNGSSFLMNGRYANFSYLSELGLIDLGETNFAPRSLDFVTNINLPAGKRGSFNLFGFYGTSAIGKNAGRDISRWTSDRDRWEEKETLGTAVAGLRHIYQLKGGNSYLRSVFAFTNYRDKYYEGLVDSSLIRTDSRIYDYRYPAARMSVMLNSKLSPKNIIRAGFNLNFLWADMKDLAMNKEGLFDTLVSPQSGGMLSQSYVQLKHRSGEKLEFISGLHLIHFTLNGSLSIEPRFGLRWNFSPGHFINAGAGIHSRIESFPVYANRIKNADPPYSTANSGLDLSRSFHLVAGADLAASKSLRIRIEGYNQLLYNIPIINNANSRYSSINSSEDLPSSVLENEGLGFNRGVELTFEKNYSSNYYALVTLSVFQSRYRAGDRKWYNSYYNNTFVSNILAGRDFYFGPGKRNSAGINIKTLIRGGYRYTPVDEVRSLRNRRIIYDQSRTYAEQLPAFFRMDAGISFRRNNPGFSWILLLDVQNLTGRQNIFRKRFRYVDYRIIETDVYSLRAIPVASFRIEF